jgi:hypothetical protein
MSVGKGPRSTFVSREFSSVVNSGDFPTRPSLIANLDFGLLAVIDDLHFALGASLVFNLHIAALLMDVGYLGGCVEDYADALGCG